jgi:hypothetical protein
MSSDQHRNPKTYNANSEALHLAAVGFASHFLLNGVGLHLPVLRAGARTWCTPVMGVNLWGASPLYKNPVTVVRQGKPSTSRRQGTDDGDIL